MERVLRTLGRSSLSASEVAAPDDVVSVDAIRQALLECLGGRGGAIFPVLERHIWLENEVAGLWCLRNDVMDALSVMQGEAHALEKMRQVTKLFAGHLPASYMSSAEELGAVSR